MRWVEEPSGRMEVVGAEIDSVVGEDVPARKRRKG